MPSAPCNFVSLHVKVKVKVELSLYMLEQGVNCVQDVEAARISGHSEHEGGNVVSPTYRSPLPPGDALCTHFC